MGQRPVTRDLVIDALNAMEEGTVEEIRIWSKDQATAETLHHAIKRMKFHPKGKMIYVCRWIRKSSKGGNHIPVFRLGDLPDAERPKPLTVAEMARRYRKKAQVVYNGRRNKRNNSSLADNPFLQLIRLNGASHRVAKQGKKKE